MSFATTAAFITNPTTANPFLARVAVAVGIAATNVLAEDPATPNHDDRKAWAGDAIRNTDAMAHTMRWGVVANASVAAAIEANPSNPTIPDGDIQFVVNSLVDSFAG